MIKQYLNILPTLIMMAALAGSLSSFSGQIKAAGVPSTHAPHAGAAVQTAATAEKPLAPR